jgi:ABC-type branched-subunit amino acid transport system substrate-binding protein
VGANAAQAAQDVPGVSKNEIRVGTLGPQTGPAAAYDGVRKGIQTYFDYVNEHGGVDGRQLKLFAYDDQYQPAKTVRAMHRLVEQDHIFATLGDIGSPTNAAVEGYVKKHHLPMIMLCSAADRFFDPPIPNYMGSCIASYTLEGQVMSYYAVKKLDDKRLALAYNNDDYGSPINEAAVKFIKKNYPDAEIVAQVPIAAGASDLSSQAQKIANAKPDAVLSFTRPAPTAHLKKALYKIGLGSDKADFITTQEGGGDPVVFDLAGKQAWTGSYSIAAMPTPKVDHSKMMQTFVKAFHKAFPDVSPAGGPEIGWAAAQVFVEAVKRTDDLTRENFLKTFYSFDDWKGSLYAGVTITKDNHHGVTTLIMTRAEDGLIKPISGYISKDPKTGKFIEETGDE